jgi:hypothetical protein
MKAKEEKMRLIATIPFHIHHGTCPGIVKRRRTPKSIVSLIVEMIEPYQGRVYDPAMGSGGFFHSVRHKRISDFRPNGASDDSPGQRPGSRRRMSRALKGRFSSNNWRSLPTDQGMTKSSSSGAGIFRTQTPAGNTQ